MLFGHCKTVEWAKTPLTGSGTTNVRAVVLTYANALQQCVHFTTIQRGKRTKKHHSGSLVQLTSDWTDLHSNPSAAIFRFRVIFQLYLFCHTSHTGSTTYLLGISCDEFGSTVWNFCIWCEKLIGWELHISYAWVTCRSNQTFIFNWINLTLPEKLLSVAEKFSIQEFHWWYWRIELKINACFSSWKPTF